MIDPAGLGAWLLDEVRRAPLDAHDQSTRDFARGVVETCLRVGAQCGVLTSRDLISIRHRMSMLLAEAKDDQRVRS